MLKLKWGVKSTLASCVVALASIVSVQANAASIGVNFETDQSYRANNEIASNETAGFIGQQNWNNVANIGTAFGTRSGSVSGLLDGSGSATGVNLAWSNVNNTYAGATLGTSASSILTGNEKLMYGMIEGQHSGATTGPNLAISGVSYAKYDVYVYMADVFRTVASVTVDDETLFYTGSNTFADGFIEATSTSSASTPTANYALFSGLTGSRFNIDMAKVSGNRAAISGFQIVEVSAVPVPASLPLLLVAMGGFGVAARRRKMR